MPPHRARIVRRTAVAGLVAALAITILLVWRVYATNGTLAPTNGGRLHAEAVVAGVVAVLFFALVVFRPERGTTTALGRTGALWAVALATGVVALWALSYNVRDLDAIHGALVTSDAEANAFLDAHPMEFEEPVYRIPTGVFLQSFEFLSDDMVQVSGFVWQRYGPDIPDTVERGVILPEAGDTYDFVEAYNEQEGDVEIVGWYFNAPLRQPFDYSHYPLDRQDIWLRLWPINFDGPVELVPDFASYRDVSPFTSTGIDEQFVFAGWDFVASGFSYVLHTYDSRFGLHDAAFLTRAPELYYNLEVKRDFLPSLIKHLPFALAVAGLVFGAMLLNTNDPELRKRFGLATLGVLGANGALLLAVVVEHSNIRSTFTSQQIAYIEVLPFTLYAMILLATVNAIALDAPNTPAIFDYRNNIWPLALYWPIFAGVIFVTTYVAFF